MGWCVMREARFFAVVVHSAASPYHRHHRSMSAAASRPSARPRPTPWAAVGQMNWCARRPPLFPFRSAAMYRPQAMPARHPATTAGSLALLLLLVAVAEGKAAAATACAGIQYTNLSDAWRATTNGGKGPAPAGAPPGTPGKVMGDTFAPQPGCRDWNQPTGVGDGNWYRFVGVGGDALALTPPGNERCGTFSTGWLSGWKTSKVGTGCKDAYPGTTTGPHCRYNKTGRYPGPEEGVVNMTACFQDDDDMFLCAHSETVGVVRCDGFLLWRLPYSDVGYPACQAAYCTTNASGL